jgi:hypothetical protein
MKNAFQNIISLIRANPEYAKMAITLDASVGLIFGLIAYVIMNAADITVTNTVVLVIAAGLALVAIAFSGYTILFKTGHSFDYDGD